MVLLGFLWDLSCGLEEGEGDEIQLLITLFSWATLIVMPVCSNPTCIRSETPHSQQLCDAITAVHSCTATMYRICPVHLWQDINILLSLEALCPLLREKSGEVVAVNVQCDRSACRKCTQHILYMVVPEYTAAIVSHSCCKCTSGFAD